MQINYDALETQVRKNVVPLYVLAGDEHLLMGECVDTIRNATSQRGLQRQIFTVDNSFKWADLQAVNVSLSLFGESKFVELRIPSGKPGKEGAKVLQAYAAEINPDNVTVISLPRLDRNSKKSAWFQAITQNAVFVEVPTIDRRQLNQWIAQRLKRQKQTASPQCIEFIANRVEGNLLAAHQEIQKLALLLPPGELSFEAICDAVMDVSRYNIFQLCEAMLSGDTSRFVRMMDGLKGEGEPLPLVLWVFTEEIRMLIRCKIALENNQSTANIKRTYRVWGEHEKLVNSRLPHLDKKTLQQALSDVVQADKIIKGLGSKTWMNDAWDALTQLGLKISRIANTHQTYSY